MEEIVHRSKKYDNFSETRNDPSNGNTLSQKTNNSLKTWTQKYVNIVYTCLHLLLCIHCTRCTDYSYTFGVQVFRLLFVFCDSVLPLLGSFLVSEKFSYFFLSVYYFFLYFCLNKYFNTNLQNLLFVYVAEFGGIT